MLVLGLVSTASATVTFEFRNAAGTTAIASIDVAVGSFTFVVSGLGLPYPGDAGWTGGAYTSDQTNGGGKADIDGVVDSLGLQLYDSAGDMGSMNYYPAFDGADLTSGDVKSATLPNPSDGVWFVVQMSLNAGAANGDKVQVDILDLVNYTVISSHQLNIVPEPATIALLGLGGLSLLRRRR